MYRLIRDVHLFLGVAFTLVWLMYGLSSVQMAHPAWFPMEPERSETLVRVDSDTTATAMDLAAPLRAAGLVRGDIRRERRTAELLTFQVVRPGTVHEVRYSPGDSTAMVVTSVGGFMNMLNRLHHYAGFWHVWGPLDLWSMLVALASVGLVLLGASGIYLWFRTFGERRIGAALLGFSLAFMVVMVIAIRLS